VYSPLRPLEVIAEMPMFRPTILVCAGPPGRDVWVGSYPGFAYPSGELQPGLLREQALRAVCRSFCIKITFHTARRAVYIIAQAEAPRRGKRSLGNRQPTHTVPEGRHKPIPLA